MHFKLKFLLLISGLLMINQPTLGWAMHLGTTTTGHLEGAGGPRPAEDVRNTLHNLGDSIAGFDNPNIVSGSGSNREVCVFCHTPHGANTSAPGAAPLWNRAVPASAGYTLYNSPNFDTTIPNQPVGVSLACLSCHDGTTAVDALINMPGSGGFKGYTPVSADIVNPQAPAELLLATGLMDGTLRGNAGETNFQIIVGGAMPFPNLTTNLSDDHPISMPMQVAATPDPQFNDVNAQDDGNITRVNRAGTAPLTYYADRRDSPRLYGASGASTNGGNKQDWVECASCHNPHAPRPLFMRLPGPPTTVLSMPSGGGTVTVGGVLGVVDTQLIADNPNAGSALCLTCHQK